MEVGIYIPDAKFDCAQSALHTIATNLVRTYTIHVSMPITKITRHKILARTKSKASCFRLTRLLTDCTDPVCDWHMGKR